MSILCLTGLFILPGCNSRSLDDVYGEWNFYDVRDYNVRIVMMIYVDSDTIPVSFRRMGKASKEQKAAGTNPNGTSYFNLKKELTGNEVTLFVESEGKREVKLKLKVLESTRKTITAEILEASDDTRLQYLVGKSLTFDIDRRKKKLPKDSSDGLRFGWH